MTPDRDTLIEYVMGSLTPEQELEVIDYLRAHPEDAAWVRDMFEVMAEVALLEEPVEMPVGAEAALLERIRGGNAVGSSESRVSEPSITESEDAAPPEVVTLPRRPNRNRWTGLAIAAALVLLVWVGVRPTYESAALQRQLDQLCDEPGVVCQALASEANEPLGTLAQRADNSLFLLMDQEPPEGRVYQAWEIVGETPQSIGVWDGRVLDITEALNSESVFGVSLEPPGGSPQPTTTPIIVVPLSG